MTKDRFFECCRNAAMKERTAEKQFKDVPWEYGELVYVGLDRVKESKVS